MWLMDVWKESFRFQEGASRSRTTASTLTALLLDFPLLLSPFPGSLNLSPKVTLCFLLAP